MFLGIEIGGTKLQLGIGAGTGPPLVALERLAVDPQAGAPGILEQIEVVGKLLLASHPVEAIGIGFGGPVDTAAGCVVKSHHVAGWSGFRLVEWCRDVFGLPAALGNDCDAAALAEARFGAGQGKAVVLYVTVGTGIGGGLVINGQLYRGGANAAVEIGHLRPGLHAERPDQTVEAVAAGWGIAAAAQARLAEPVTRQLSPLLGRARPDDPESIRARLLQADEHAEQDAADLLRRCGLEPADLTAKIVAEAARDGNGLARDILDHACQTLGWAIAQAITLLAPQVIVLGGGVASMGQQFLVPVRHYVNRYVFEPLAGSFDLVPAQLGEEVVVHGALSLAHDFTRK